MVIRVEVVRGDITAQDVDAVVNAANSSLLGGGGVDGAIHGAAGPELLRECQALRAGAYRDGLEPGHAVATGAGHMRARHVIHTVGPKHWEYPDGGGDVLASCHRESLREASRLGLHSIAFPAISCGVYGWSPRDAAPIAVQAVRDFDARHPDHGIDVVRFVLFNDETQRAFENALNAVE